VTDDEIVATLTAAFGAEQIGGWQVTFTQPTTRMSMNDRTHWRKRHRRTKTWRHAAFYAAVAQLGASPAARVRPPCFVRVIFPVPDPGRRRDPHNQAPTVKAIVDGLVDAGVWRDDTPDQVAILDPRFAAPADGFVVVQLIPRANGAV
jgi:hypothetical protein